MTGPQGEIGLTGMTGPDGIQGLTGTTGPQGEVGLTGMTGPQGLTGMTGPDGMTGPAGATGVVDFIAGTFVYADLVAGILTIVHSKGNAILPFVITDNNGQNATLDSTAVTFSNNQITVDLISSGIITGTWGYAFGGSAETGATGPTGPSGGPTGATGPTGLIGPTGATGPAGAAGATGPDRSAVYVINAQTGTSYTLELTDVGRLVTLTNVSPIAVTIPTNALKPFGIGTRIDFIQGGAGKVTFSGAGVTIKSKSNNKSISDIYVAASLTKELEDTWYLVGDLIA
jgi:hypothetical protein